MKSVTSIPFGATRLNIALCLLIASTTCANAAVDTFAKLGDIVGESHDIRHQGESDVTSLSWSMSHSGPTRPGGGAAVVQPGGLTIQKRIDKATPKLMEACANGTHLNTAVLTLRQAGENGVEFYRIICEDVVISSITANGTADDGKPIENITLNFARAGVQYIQILSNGQPGEKKRFAWNFAENREGGVTFPDDPQTDTDADGLPDWWEIEFGLNLSTPDASADADRDGATNLEEFIAGTAPNSPNSVFKAQLRTQAGAATGTLQWSSAPDREYRVYMSDSLAVPFQLFGTFPSAGEDTTINVPVNPSMRFFRVEVAAD